MSAMSFKKTDAYQKRAARAKSTEWKLAVAGPNSFAIRGENSDNAHILRTRGTDAVECSCPDYQNRPGIEKCKHAIAYEEWLNMTVVE